LHVGNRIDHPGVGFLFHHALVVSRVADIAEIPEGVTLVPACAIVVDRVFALHFVAVLARRGLRAALGIGIWRWS
jgi:hypothetical protein